MLLALAWLCAETGSFHVTLNGGTYWLNLQNAVVANGEPVFWDQNNRPSQASENTVGTIYSEAFSILGATSGSDSTPEASSLLLFGTGVLGLAGILRRKLS